jgi:tRNA dimethylallyltransferase
MASGPKSAKALIFLLGATGVGKSDVALEAARAHPEFSGRAAILALDAMQVYRGADIGTGKPSAAERKEIPHGGLDLAEIGEEFDTARYVAHALEFLREQDVAGRRVIAVGGTGLYFRALTRGLCEAPRGSAELRAELARLSTKELRERLAQVDPEIIPRLDTENPRRLARAIEVMETSGRSLRGGWKRCAGWWRGTARKRCERFRPSGIGRLPNY